MWAPLRPVAAVLAVVLAIAGGYIGHDVLTAGDEARVRAELVAATAPQGQLPAPPADTGVVVLEVVAGTSRVVAGDPAIVVPPGLLAVSEEGSGATKTESGWTAVVLSAARDGDQVGAAGSSSDPDTTGARGSDPLRRLASGPAASRLVVAAPVGLSGPVAALAGVVLVLLALGLLAAVIIRPTQRTRLAAPPVPDRERGQPAGGYEQERTTSPPRSAASGELISRVIEVRDVVPQRALAARLDAGLSSVGIESFDPTGQPFDGRCHRAVEVRASTDPVLVGTVAQTERVGYFESGGLFRPADVVVYQDSDKGVRP